MEGTHPEPRPERKSNGSTKERKAFRLEIPLPHPALCPHLQLFLVSVVQWGIVADQHLSPTVHALPFPFTSCFFHTPYTYYYTFQIPEADLMGSEYIYLPSTFSLLLTFNHPAFSLASIILILHVSLYSASY